MQLSLTLEQALTGHKPIPWKKKGKEWKKLNDAVKEYQRELDWKQFQSFLQRVERSRERREIEARRFHIANKPRPYKDDK